MHSNLATALYSSLCKVSTSITTLELFSGFISSMATPLRSNRVVLTSSSSTPTNPTLGTIYFDDGTNTDSGNAKPRFYTAASTFRDFGEYPDVAVLVDNTGTTGGSYPSAVDITREINSIRVQPRDNWVSIASNRFTIDGATYPGTYFIEWQVPAYRTDEFYSFLREDPAGSPSTVAVGKSGVTDFSSDANNSYSMGTYRVDLTASTTYDVRFRAGIAGFNTNALGVAHLRNSDEEAYAYVNITRFI